MEELDIITLELEDGESVNCGIVDFCEMDGQDYVALLEVTDEGEPAEDAEMLIFRYNESEDGEEFEINNIENETEFNAAVKVFEEMWEEEEDDEE